MKIAAVTEDGTTISHHFGRAPLYVVVTVEEGHIIAHEQRDKAGHRQFASQQHDHEHEHHADHGQGSEQHYHGMGTQADGRHAQMAHTIADCEAILVRGMGMGAYQGMKSRGITPVITDIASIDEAVMAYVEGHIVDHTERLH
jgi:predicted Fe-Mo cluster-binding NifX family protein